MLSVEGISQFQQEHIIPILLYKTESILKLIETSI